MSFLMTDNTIIVGDRTFKAVPTSCRCGGSWAWVEVLAQSPVAPNGTAWEKIVMIGCVCHHTLPIAPSEVVDPVCVCNMDHSGFAFCDLHNNPFICICYSIGGDEPTCPVHG